MGKTPSTTPDTQWRRKRRAPLTLGGQPSCRGHARPAHGLCLALQTPKHLSPPPPPSGRGVAGETGWPRREAGERKHPDQGPELELSPASVTGAHFPDSRPRQGVSGSSALYVSGAPGTLSGCLTRSRCPARPLSWGPQRLVLQQ